MMVLNLVLHETQMTFTKFQWSINFCIFFSHISAGCQLIKKNKCWFIISILVPNIWQEYLWWSISFNFWVCHFLLHREVKKPNILERMSADFKNIGSFYIILEHFKFVCQQNCWSISFEGECNFYTQCIVLGFVNLFMVTQAQFSCHSFVKWCGSCWVWFYFVFWYISYLW